MTLSTDQACIYQRYQDGRRTLNRLITAALADRYPLDQAPFALGIFASRPWLAQWKLFPTPANARAFGRSRTSVKDCAFPQVRRVYLRE